MDNKQFLSYTIEERSYVSFIKREIHNLVKSHFTEQRVGQIDIVVAEMTSNLIKHAGNGEILYRLTAEAGQPVFEVICIDNGPGMKDVNLAMRDGVSTKNTLGHGFGSIIRLSNMAQVYSQPDWGTIVYAKFYPSPEHKTPPQQVIVRSINVAKPGETVSGDGTTVKVLPNRTLIFAGDGLGHGIHAKEAVEKAIAAFNSSMTSDPSQLLMEMDQAVKKTRGLVATIAFLDHNAKRWHICGVGNIHTRLHQGLEYKNYICNNGIIGLNIPRRLENASFEKEKFQLLILCSDGIRTKWDLTRYPAILKYDAIILAAAIYKDHARKTDDMSVLIVKVL
jgi:anti-sigma regulatory factor (Ser/Thr protein kinase)